MKARYHHSEQIASHIRTFYFETEKPLEFTAGQFTELTLPHANPDNRGTKRWFTISSSPTDEYVTITTKFASEGGSTFKEALAALEPGTEVHLADAMGDFVLPKLLQTPIICVAGGIGITPFHSMLKWLAATHEERPIKLLYAVANEEEIIFQDTFEAAKVHPTIVVSQPSSAWGGERGRLNAEMILGIEQPTDDTLIYLSGPEPMIEAITNSLNHHGIKKSQLVTDFFPGYDQF